MTKRIVKNDLYDYQNRYIFQYDSCFKFSLDSILLAEFVENITDSKKLLDLCTGNAAIPLIITTKNKCKIDCVEIQKDIFELACKSIEYNELSEYITPYNIDANEFDTIVGNKIYDIITCNPPYFKINKNSYLNQNEELMIARHESSIVLEDVFNIANRHLNNKGELYLVHQSSRLDEIINLGYKYNIKVKKIQMIKTSINKKPSLVLVKCVKSSKSGLIVNKEICIEGYSTYQNIFKEEL